MSSTFDSIQKPAAFCHPRHRHAGPSSLTWTATVAFILLPVSTLVPYSQSSTVSCPERSSSSTNLNKALLCPQLLVASYCVAKTQSPSTAAKPAWSRPSPLQRHILHSLLSLLSSRTGFLPSPCTQQWPHLRAFALKLNLFPQTTPFPSLTWFGSPHKWNFIREVFCHHPPSNRTTSLSLHVSCSSSFLMANYNMHSSACCRCLVLASPNYCVCSVVSNLGSALPFSLLYPLRPRICLANKRKLDKYLLKFKVQIKTPKITPKWGISIIIPSKFGVKEWKSQNIN